MEERFCLDPEPTTLLIYAPELYLYHTVSGAFCCENEGPDRVNGGKGACELKQGGR